MKEWLSCRVHHGTRTSAEIAEEAHIPHGRLKSYANPEQTDSIPFAALVRLCRVPEDFSVIDLVLVDEGYRLTRVSVEKVKRLEMEALDVAAAAGHLVAEVQKAMTNGVDPHEVATLRQLAHKLRQEADELESSLPKDQITRVK